jgi:uncharacterized protein (DUF305 family)
MSAGGGETERQDLERQDLERQYWAEIERQRQRFVEADVEFMQGMILHHAQALEMVALVGERSGDLEIHRLSARIEQSQRDEIRLMERWLAVRGFGASGDAGGGAAGGGADAGHAGHAGHTGHDAHAAMPGMLSPDQLEALAAAGGRAFDRLFLELMIQHHEGAVLMVRTLFDTDGAAQDPEVFRFASDVQVDQATEIRRMEGMLRARPAG